MSAPEEAFDLSLSVILPAFNESHRLPATFREIRPYLESRFATYEVIVVDDGSTDATAAVVDQAAREWPQLKLLRQPRNRGKGAAVRRGCLAAAGDLILYMDADHATPIQEVEGMLHHFRGDSRTVVVGVRTYQENESKWRRVLGICLQLLAHLVIFQKAVIDSQCGFKCFSKEAARELLTLSRVDGGMFDVELFFLMHKLGIPVYYQPVHWANKAGSRINILKCVLFDPIDLLAIRGRSLLGLYQKGIIEVGSRRRKQA